MNATAGTARFGSLRWRWSPLTRARVLGATAASIVTLVAIVMLPIGAVTAFRARRLYAVAVRGAALLVLRLYGLRLRVHQSSPFPRTQTVYVSNHTSTIDLFALVALGLPNCRFFLSGFLRQLVPLGILAWMMGTFFTVPQDRPDERRRIFPARGAHARGHARIRLSQPRRRTDHDGSDRPLQQGRVPSRHRRSARPSSRCSRGFPLHADPGRGYDARPGIVDVHVLAAIDTREWKVEDVAVNTERVRSLFVETHTALSTGSGKATDAA